MLNLMDANKSCMVKMLNIMDANINGFTILRTTLSKFCGRITIRCERSADRSGDLRSGRTRAYSEKPSSMVTTRCDAENPVFLATHCDR